MPLQENTKLDEIELVRLLDYLWQASPHNKERITEEVKGKIQELITLAYNTGRKHQSEIDISALPKEKNEYENPASWEKLNEVEKSFRGQAVGHNNCLSQSKENLIKEEKEII